MFSIAQEKIELQDTYNLLLEGVEHHAEGEYDKAIELYDLVTENDSNYVLAQLEKAFSCIQAERNEEAVLAASNALEYEAKILPELYINMGTAYDNMEKPNKAIETYDLGLERFPKNGSLLFNKAITLQKLKRYDEAIEVYKEILDILPCHASTHLRLGVLAANEGRNTQAALSLLTFLLLEPESSRSINVVSYLNGILSTPATDTAAIKHPFLLEDDFSEIDLILANGLAMSKKYKIPTRYDFPIIKQSHAILEQLKFDKKAEGFWMQYYVTFYEQLFDEGWFESFAHYILLSSDNEVVEAEVKKNMSGIKKFDDWLLTAWLKAHENHTLVVNGKKKDVKYWYKNTNWLQGIGIIEDDKLVGDWLFYHKTGALSSEKHYTAEGIGEKEWKYYYENGNKSAAENFKDGELNGTYESFHTNGNRYVQQTYKDGKREGLYKEYNLFGNLLQEEFYTDGALNGECKYYFSNGNLKLTLNYVDGQLQGKAKRYYPTGELELEAEMKDNQKEGKYTLYHKNGKIKGLENYVGNLQEGEYEAYYSNGNLKVRGVAKENKLVLENVEYQIDGVTVSEKTNYDETGKLNGLRTVYDYDGKKHFEWTYNKGEIAGYVYYDKSGGIISEAKRKLTKFPFKGYYANGDLKFEGDYDGSKQNGVWKYYYKHGVLKSVEPYEKGDLNGELKEYFINGELLSIAPYENGQVAGYFKSFYNNGQLDRHGNYVKDHAQGYWEYFYPDGSWDKKLYYSNDQLQGWQNYYDPEGRVFQRDYYENDILLKSEFLDTAGQVLVLNDLLKENVIKSNHYTGKPYFKGGYVSGISNGDFEWYYNNGNLATKGKYIEGEKEGVWTWYYPNGNKKEEKTYIANNKYGRMLDYHENGQIEKDRTTFNDNIEGASVWYHYNGVVSLEGFYKNGERDSIFKNYDQMGNLQYVRYYELGQLVGYSYQDEKGGLLPMIPIKGETAHIVAYFQNGKKSIEYDLDKGMYQSIYTEYNSNGSVLESCSFIDDNYEGDAVEYYSNGNKKYEKKYSQGMLNGLVVKYYESGALKSSETYKSGDLHGKAQYFDENGQKIKSIEYYNERVLNEVSHI